MKTLDCRDLPVPKPVVLAKSTLEELPQNSIVTFIVNSDMSEDNIISYAQNKGYFVKREQKHAGIFITISKSFACDLEEKSTNERQIKNKALIITNDCIGRGLNGDKLMQEFLDSICLQKHLPSKIIFINKGVRLACCDDDCATIKSLQQISEKGVNLLVSISSLEELDLRKNHKIGSQISMYEFAETLINYDTSTI